jgi:hypothetical protein
MSATTNTILRDLQRVAHERGVRARDPSLQARVRAVKHYQHRRFALTYADLLADARYAAASRFFLDELYGPRDFSERDAQFERVVAPLVRMFSREIVGTVAALARLHALSEALDSEMGRQLDPTDTVLTGPVYVRAWQATGLANERSAQIDLIVHIGAALDHYTHRPMLRYSLRALRGPAAAAGLANLQRFLEAGFDTFRAMRGATAFLATIESRERALAAQLFSARAVVDEDGKGRVDNIALGQLP